MRRIRAVVVMTLLTGGAAMLAGTSPVSATPVTATFPFEDGAVRTLVVPDGACNAEVAEVRFTG